MRYPEYPLPGNEIKLVNLMKDSGVVDSTSDAYRLIKAGAVSMDGLKITDKDKLITGDKGFVLKIGKRKFMKFVLQN